MRIARHDLAVANQIDQAYYAKSCLNDDMPHVSIRLTELSRRGQATST